MPMKSRALCTPQTVLWFLAIGLSLGCGEAERCRDLSQDACESAGHCGTVMGMELDEHGRVQEHYVGCLESGRVCGGAETCAKPYASDRAVLFRSTCIPDGWTVADCSEIYRARARSREPNAESNDAGPGIDGGP
jgi:hypothetical protein